MLYQEALQKVYQNLTDCTLSEAEEFRSNVAKKKKEKIEKAYPFFIERATRKIGPEAAKKIWEAFIPWSAYGFCKAHAVSYATIGYSTALIKHVYPLQWWCAVLKNADKNEINEEFWRYCGDFIDTPDLKLSGSYFEIQGDRIRAPISLLHGIGEGAHQQLLKYAPYKDLRDFCEKIEYHKTINGQNIKKIQKKYKTVKDPITKEKKKETIEIEVDAFKKGHSAINRRVVYTLIIAGAMDSLFPSAKTIDGVEYPYTFIDQLEDFEKVYSEVSGSKLTQPDTEYISVTALQRFQLKKQILPAYSDDLAKLYSNSYSGTHKIYSKNDHNYIVYKGNHLRFVSPDEIDLIEAVGIPDGQPIKMAAGVYVEDSRNFNYQGNKLACELLLDICGGRFKYVKWPDYKTEILPELFKTELKGSLGVVILNKYRDDKDIALEDLIIIEPPRK